MSRVGGMPGRRVRAYAFTAVTTAVVLLFAMAEWATERLVSGHSRAVSTAIEVSIVLVAALVFRPIHQRVEGFIEAAFYRRKHLALAALAKFRRELTSFNDSSQLLRRVVEAIEHHLGASESAVYLRREDFRAEVSSFDVPAEPVATDDALVVRLRSTGSPVRLRPLKSAVLGTHAFPMTVAGELVGILALQYADDFDAEELQMLTGLAQDLAVAVAALDPTLRRARVVPNNIPANLPVLVGRDCEIAELEAALAQFRLLTITGPGGVGKTCLAQQCAANAIARHQHGAWFVNLAPIADGKLVAASILSALDASSPGPCDDVERLVEYLRPRDLLLVLDNCEQLLTAVAPLITQILAQCAGVCVLATSREILHLDGEHVYRLAPLRIEEAVELFSQCAGALSPGYDAQANVDTVRSICERLDGIPLAIELAAARVRALSVDDIADHLHERFQLLTGGARGALPRQQTLSATIEWSYDLLTEEEQSLFLRLATFRGTFSLGAAAAVCSQGGRCDEFHVLDVLTSLADKSLLTVTVGIATRYGLLESVREFALKKAVEQHAASIAAQHHAAYFAQLAAQAYHEFDSRLPEGWLDRLAPDIDNFRAALVWTLEGPGDRAAGAQLAADCGPVFLRLELLREGLRWCVAANRVPNLPPATLGRIEYVASMMYNNLNESLNALECAKRAVEAYKQSSDERGTIRALSQVAQLHARSKDFSEARAPAEEAIRRGRELGEPRILIAVLRRCAFALPQSEITTARAYYMEALDLARSARDRDETCLVLSWWAYDEAATGAFDRAIELATEAMQLADRDSEKVLENQLATWLLALGRFEAAAPHARNGLSLALEAKHEQLTALGIAFCAPIHAQHDPREAATLFGYAEKQLDDLGWSPAADDCAAFNNVAAAISAHLPHDDFDALRERGATLNEEEALRLILPTLALGRKRSYVPVGGGNAVRTLLI
ncbi:MAG: GAF domain-containing protein [Candidatus Eremiobacteraeota bacterium]|nr:GAF domain-containing protein [Candidatus Eremiobacteraeota bacterium]